MCWEPKMWLSHFLFYSSRHSLDQACTKHKWTRNEQDTVFFFFNLKKYIILALDKPIVYEQHEKKLPIISSFSNVGWTWGSGTENFIKGYRGKISKSAWARLEGKGKLWRFGAHQLRATSPRRAKKQDRREMAYKRLSGQTLEHSGPEFISHNCYFILVETWTTSLPLTHIKWRW